jgi:hypothetical protein
MVPGEYEGGEETDGQNDEERALEPLREVKRARENIRPLKHDPSTRKIRERPLHELAAFETLEE